MDTNRSAPAAPLTASLPWLLLTACVSSVCAFLPLGCVTIPALPESQVQRCSEVTPLFAATQAIDDQTHPCHDWIDKTHGRIARSSSASAVIWSRRTTYGTGLLVSALHTLGAGWFGPTDEALAATLFDPAGESGIARFTLIEESGRDTDDALTPMFHLYHPAVPAVEHTAGLADILPRRDFFLTVVDDQKLTGDSAASPAALTNGETPIYDPAQLTTTAPTFAEANTNSLVLMLGFPRSGSTAGTLSASVGRVLTDSEAEAVIADLALAGDVEGDIAYDPEAEMLIEGFARQGMSGGGIFDTDATLVGVLVRASDLRDERQYVRAVRMTFIVDELNEAWESASAEQQEAVSPYMEPRNAAKITVAESTVAIRTGQAP